ncbi:hypothetical protein HF521_007212 [Silurus meridionalis]|uniref:Uncharacterized protein n=1 Tax=Silurus meridionalis TaxID=175797 RepID=A0A8T0AUS3_SILME|nr:hypothetical protein HF521_007212 [Silurus meridionalis]
MRAEKRAVKTSGMWAGLSRSAAAHVTLLAQKHADLHAISAEGKLPGSEGLSVLSAALRFTHRRTLEIKASERSNRRPFYAKRAAFAYVLSELPKLTTRKDIRQACRETRWKSPVTIDEMAATESMMVLQSSALVAPVTALEFVGDDCLLTGEGPILSIFRLEAAPTQRASLSVLHNYRIHGMRPKLQKNDVSEIEE